MDKQSLEKYNNDSNEYRKNIDKNENNNIIPNKKMNRNYELNTIPFLYKELKELEMDNYTYVKFFYKKLFDFVSL